LVGMLGPMTDTPPVCWREFFRALKRSKAPKGSVLEEFRIAVLHDVDFCWAAVEENGQAAHDALRYVAWRMWPDPAEIPKDVLALLAAGKVAANW
jgi:hypothetical protein